MSVPLSADRNVGYVEAEDVYIVFSEYYGGGTIYGRQTLQTPEGEAVRGLGKSVQDLIAAGVVVLDDQSGATCGDLVRVPLESTPPEGYVPSEVSAEPVAEVFATSPVPEAAAPVPEAAAPVPEVVAPEPAPETVAPEAAAPAQVPAPPYTVRLVHPDFTVEYKQVLSVEVSTGTGSLTFSAK